MTHSESIKDLAAALSKAQGQMGALLKDKDNPYFKSKYADLAAVWDACREALSSNGLAVVQAPAFDPDHADHVCLDTVLMHSSGEWLISRSAMKAVKNDPQTMLATLTYLRRGVLQSVVGLAAEDDDGNAASGRDSKVSDAAAKVAAAAAGVQAAPRPRPKATPAAERVQPAPAFDESGLTPHESNTDVMRRLFMARAKKAGLSDVEAGAVGKGACGKASSKDFTEADWQKCLGQIDMRDRWLAYAVTKGFDANEAVSWALEIGFAWDVAWNPSSFEDKMRGMK